MKSGSYAPPVTVRVGRAAWYACIAKASAGAFFANITDSDIFPAQLIEEDIPLDVVSVEKPTNKELLSRCLRLLARRDLPRAEFVNKLRTAGFDRDEIEGAADWAEAEGFLDENRYAEVAARRLSGKYSASRVVHTLRDRGVTEAAIADVAPGLKLSELDQARAIWIRRFHEPASNPNDKSRQIRFLQARGFSFDIIKQVIKGPEN